MTRGIPPAILTSLALGVLLLAPLVADAQTSQPATVAFAYGLSVGAGTRWTDGVFRPKDFPAGASQPRARQTVLALDLDGGLALTRRFAIFARLESGGAFLSSSAGNWGTLGIHGVARAWLTRQVWIEGGAGVTQFGYKPPPQMSVAVSSWWAPAQEGSAGVDIFQGPHVAINAFGRYTTAMLDGLRVNKIAVQVGLTSR